MPFLIPLTMAGATLIAGAGATGAAIYATKKESSAQRHASDTAAAAETEGTTAQLDYLKEKDKQEQANWERAYTAREARMAPYRAVGDQASRTLASLIRTPGPYPTKPRPTGARPVMTRPTPPARRPMMFDPATGQLVPVAPTNLRQLTAGVV
jgi:hypothetical protein